jgi:hypothetical protein
MKVDPGKGNQSLQIVGTVLNFMPVKKQRVPPPTNLDNRHPGRVFLNE